MEGLTTIPPDIIERQSLCFSRPMPGMVVQQGENGFREGLSQLYVPAESNAAEQLVNLKDALRKADTDSFWISGNFEETKLARIKPGDPAVAQLLGFQDPVYGHVDSIARGINTPNSAPGALGLASVNPVFTWVRLAQRLPVRIHIDKVPPTVQLSVGLTATVSVGKDAHEGSLHGWLSRTLTMGGN